MVKNHKGFTLTEILLVVSLLIILGLALLIGLNPMNQILKGYDSRRRADIQEIKIAFENYYADHECYPISTETDAKNQPSYICGSDFLAPYLKTMPCDPTTKEPYTLYMKPELSQCPQEFSIYADMNAKYDSNADFIPYCNKTIAASSPDMSSSEVSYGCSEIEVCSNHYGCRNGACIWLSGYDAPACTPNYCTDTCGQPTDEAAHIYCQTADNSCQ